MKQILHTAKEERFDNLVNNTIGIVSVDSLFKYMLIKLHVLFFMLYFGCRCFIAVHILAANLQISLGKWALCFVLLQRLEFKVTFPHSTVDVD